MCRDGRSSDYETDIDCGGICEPCAIDDRCKTANDCVSGLCKDYVCRERAYDPTEPIPPGYHLEPSNDDRATTARNAGIGFFVLSYGAAYVGALSAPSSLAWLYVPLVGPWALLDDAEDFAPKGGVRLTKMLLVTDGAFQIAGVLMWIGGTLGRGQQLLKNPKQTEEQARVWISPTLGRAGYYGFQVDARF